RARAAGADRRRADLRLGQGRRRRPRPAAEPARAAAAAGRRAVPRHPGRGGGRGRLATAGPPRRAGGAATIFGTGGSTGPGLGRAAIIRALYWHSLRSAFGIGRGAKAKVVPILMFALMCLPAIVNAIVVARTPGHARIVDYDTYTYRLRSLVMLIFVAAQ